MKDWDEYDFIAMVRWKFRSLSILTYCVIFSVLFCDWYLFPFLFSNVVHSRYFSLQCKNANDSSCNELNQLFVTRKTNCDRKANEYWMSQPRKLSTKSDDGFDEYWSHRMSQFLEYNKQRNLDLLVMIISVRRRHESYLKHITKLLHQQTNTIDTSNTGGVDLVICNSDAELGKHHEAVYLSQFIDVISINRTTRSHKCCSNEDW